MTKNHNNEYQDIITGVRQGTILGPLLFILYINGLLTDMDKETIISYADDTVIISSDNNWIAAQNKLNLYLDKVATWLAHNKLSLNLGKTVYRPPSGKSRHVDFCFKKRTRRFFVEKTDTSGLNFFLY